MTDLPLPTWIAMTKPCKHGHLGWRDKTGRCVECSRITVARYRATPKAIEKFSKWQAKYRATERGKQVQSDGNARRYASEEGKKKVRESLLRRTYGITLEEFDAMDAVQSGRCAICSTDKPGGRGVFHVDHCHKTKSIRGLLCASCNLGIGSLKDNPIILRQAANYIEKHAGLTI